MLTETKPVFENKEKTYCILFNALLMKTMSSIMALSQKSPKISFLEGGLK